MMPTNWISRSAQNAARSEKFHSFSENRWTKFVEFTPLENLAETRWDLIVDPTNEEPISAAQLNYLKIFNYDGSPPKTKVEASQLIADLRYHWKDKEPPQEQISYLKKLGYKGPTPKTRGDASNLISDQLYRKAHKITDDDIPYTIYGSSWSEENPFELGLNEHKPEFYKAKEWRASLDN